MPRSSHDFPCSYFAQAKLSVKGEVSIVEGRPSTLYIMSTSDDQVSWEDWVWRSDDVVIGDQTSTNMSTQETQVNMPTQVEAMERVIEIQGEMIQELSKKMEQMASKITELDSAVVALGESQMQHTRAPPDLADAADSRRTTPRQSSSSQMQQTLPPGLPPPSPTEHDPLRPESRPALGSLMPPVEELIP
jgi:hypothetical protein